MVYLRLQRRAYVEEKRPGVGSCPRAVFVFYFLGLMLWVAI